MRRVLVPSLPRPARAILGPAAILLAASLSLAPAHALSQQSEGGRVRQPSTEKAKPAPRASTLDELFDRLQRTTDAVEAKGIAGAIERRWMRSGSDTANLLMDRALEAVHGGDQALAVELLDRVVAFQPNWAEGWNKRATVFYMMGDTTRAMADLERVLTLEPRHFNALAGLGAILRANGDDKRAFDAFRKALAVNPHMSELKEAVQRMAPDVEGRDI